VTILLPQIPEASQLDAPSTSSTMMMALGDALALTLAEIRGFSHDDFRLLHPGGTIGARMITVKDLMHAGDDMPLIHANSSASEMIIEITRKRMGCVGVIDNNGELIGIVTDGDLRRHIDLDIKRSVASDFMHLNPVTVDQDLLGVRALNLMNSKAITSIFIVEDHKPIGIIHMHDLLKFGIC
jgi:arabinose-5-phosphate isomerase